MQLTPLVVPPGAGKVVLRLVAEIDGKAVSLDRVEFEKGTPLPELTVSIHGATPKHLYVAHGDVVIHGRSSPSTVKVYKGNFSCNRFNGFGTISQGVIGSDTDHKRAMDEAAEKRLHDAWLHTVLGRVTDLDPTEDVPPKTEAPAAKRRRVGRPRKVPIPIAPALVLPPSLRLPNLHADSCAERPIDLDMHIMQRSGNISASRGPLGPIPGGPPPEPSPTEWQRIRVAQFDTNGRPNLYGG